MILRTLQNIHFMWKNRKAMEIAFSTIITLALILIVLVVIAKFFLTGSQETLTPLASIQEEAGSELQKSATDVLPGLETD